MVWWGTGIPLPATPPSPHPGYTPATRYPLHAMPAPAAHQTKYGRGAQIGSPTHLRAVILSVQGYDRGI